MSHQLTNIGSAPALWVRGTLPPQAISHILFIFSFYFFMRVCSELGGGGVEG